MPADDSWTMRELFDTLKRTRKILDPKAEQFQDAIERLAERAMHQSEPTRPTTTEFSNQDLIRELTSRIDVLYAREAAAVDHIKTAIDFAEDQLLDGVGSHQVVLALRRALQNLEAP